VEERRPWWILTGGSHRLGRALAEGLALEHNLVLTSSRPWEDEDHWETKLSTGTHVRTLRWDASDPGLVPQMMADLERLGAEGIRFQSAVLVAGTFPEQPFGTWTSQAIRDTLAVNLTFPMLAAQALAPWIQDQGSLQLILDTAIHRPMLRRLPYSAAKAGLAALVPGLARLLAPRIRVAGHALGVVMPDEASDAEALAERNLLKRNGSPEDLLRALRYVAESPYLTGEILTLDGGRRWA
jgi:pteridine reductase